MTFAIQMIIMAVFGVVLGEIIKWFAERRLSDIANRAKHEERFIGLANRLLSDERLPDTQRRRIVGYANTIRSAWMEKAAAKAMTVASKFDGDDKNTYPERLPADLAPAWSQMFLSFLLAVTYRSFFHSRMMRTRLDVLFDQENLRITENIVDERGLREHAFAA
jgi:hypothetical protein